MTSAYQLFPRLTRDEYESLRRDIEDNGVLVPIVEDEDGNVIDGWHRREIARELGVHCPTDVLRDLTEEDKLELAFSLNIARRHLSGHDRTAVITECRRRGMSLRAIADVVGVSHQTVKRDLIQSVTNVTPEHEQAEEREPLPAQETRQERAEALRAEGWTLRAIADELGCSVATVHNLLNPSDGRRTDSVTPAEWGATERLIQGLQDFAKGDARYVAASVPGRNRRATAKRLRHVGRFLGEIAYELEQEEAA